MRAVPSIGDTLREARMRQRLDIADVEEKTKIRAKYLRALENEEFALLPGSTFARTFLRTYAEELGLDPHVLVEEYRTNFEPRDELDIQFGAPSGGGAPRERERRYPGGPPSRWTVIGGLAAALLAFLIVLGLLGDNEDKGKGRQAAEKTRKAKKRPKPRRKPLPAAVSLQVTPDGPTYVCVDNGPGTATVFQGTISEPRSFKAKKIRVNLGRTAVTLRLNGKDFPVAPSATPVGYEFSVKGSKQLPSDQRPTCTT
jgi:hypothetical protein